MIKVSVLYPNADGNTFDLDYYTSKHLALVGALLGDAVKGATVEKGLGGAAPGAPATFSVMSNLYFDTVEDFQNSFGPNADEIMADLPNFCNSAPTIQVSEVVI